LRESVLIGCHAGEGREQATRRRVLSGVEAEEDHQVAELEEHAEPIVQKECEALMKHGARVDEPHRALQELRQVSRHAANDSLGQWRLRRPKASSSHDAAARWLRELWARNGAEVEGAPAPADDAHRHHRADEEVQGGAGSRDAHDVCGQRHVSPGKATPSSLAPSPMQSAQAPGQSRCERWRHRATRRAAERSRGRQHERSQHADFKE